VGAYREIFRFRCCAHVEMCRMSVYTEKKFIAVHPRGGADIFLSGTDFITTLLTP